MTLAKTGEQFFEEAAALPVKTESCGFNDTFNHTLDAKKRLFIPAKLREELGDSFLLYCPFDDECVYAYSEKGFAHISQQVQDTRDRNYQRLFYSRVTRAETDKQGRITLKTEFCEFAGLKKDVTIAGVGRRVEIWDSARRKKAIEHAEAISSTYDTSGIDF